MALRPHRLIVALVLASFVLAVFGCVISCTEGDEDCHHELPGTMSLSLPIPRTDTYDRRGVAAVGSSEFVPLPTRINQRLIVASIFQPPRA